MRTRSLLSTSPVLSTPDSAILRKRRERVFLVLAGLFLGTLAMLNILGISRFLFVASWDGGLASISNFRWFSGSGAVVISVAVGVLPYPITFLCTDLISEFYGRKRANFLVMVGLLVNLWVVGVIWLGGVLPGSESEPFFAIRGLAFGAVTASMIAYLIAQFVDVQLFHFWKNLTRGKALWLRNNGSTLVSQLVDTVAVILITYQLGGLDFAVKEDTHVPTMLLTFIASGYVFKVLVALLDTPLIYLSVHFLRGYLRIDPTDDPRGSTGDVALFDRAQ